MINTLPVPPTGEPGVAESASGFSNTGVYDTRRFLRGPWFLPSALVHQIVTTPPWHIGRRDPFWERRRWGRLLRSDPYRPLIRWPFTAPRGCPMRSTWGIIVKRCQGASSFCAADLPHSLSLSIFVRSPCPSQALPHFLDCVLKGVSACLI